MVNMVLSVSLRRGRRGTSVTLNLAELCTGREFGDTRTIGPRVSFDSLVLAVARSQAPGQLYM
jgi:hypothetical protein